VRAEPACHIVEHRSSDWARQIDRTWSCGICQPPSPALVTGGLVVRRSELDNSHQDESSAAPEASTDLTAAETDRLVELEQAVDRGLQTFVEVGQALAEIRERKLYRASHDTFERYCRERWGFTRQRALQFIDAAAVTTVVVKAGLPAPTHEAQARELVPLRKRPDELETAWRDTLIVANAAGRSPWAELVRQNVIEVQHRDHPSAPTQACAAAHRAPDEPTPADTERAVVGAVERFEQAVTAWEQLNARCGRLVRPLGAQTGMALLARLERIETSIAKLKAEIVQKIGEGAA
jgi:hypothetical protein